MFTLNTKYFELIQKLIGIQKPKKPLQQTFKKKKQQNLSDWF